jgi:hypothetical protein
MARTSVTTVSRIEWEQSVTIESQGENEKQRPSNVVERSGSISLVNVKAGVVNAVSGFYSQTVNQSVKLINLQGAAIIMAAVLAPALVCALARDFVARDPVPTVVFVCLACWTALAGVVLVISLAAARFRHVGPILDAALGRSLSRYDHHYRSWVVSRMHDMPNTMLPTVGPQAPEFDAVFIDVSLVSRAPKQVDEGLLGDAPASVTERHSIWSFLDREPTVLVVLGVPGGGKSTLLRHVARRIALRARLPRQRTIPVHLTLRDHVRRIVDDMAPDLPTLVRELPGLPDGEPPQWWETRLRRGKCVVLMDGLDELRENDRAGVVKWIDAQRSRYRQNQFVLTSRPHGYTTALLEGAKVLQVRPFTDQQVKAFLRAWYRAVERQESGVERSVADKRAQAGTSRLIARLASAPALHDLMINPLLLTMIANVHKFSGRPLPDSRAQLYAEVCEVMLKPRGEPMPDSLAKEITDKKQRVLASVAFHLMNKDDTVLSQRELLRLLTRQKASIPEDKTPAEFLADAKANGILVEAERGRYAFVHLTFQEFLAARHIGATGRRHVLIETVDQPRWREVTLLLVADGHGHGHGQDHPGVSELRHDRGTLAGIRMHRCRCYRERTLARAADPLCDARVSRQVRLGAPPARGRRRGRPPPQAQGANLHRHPGLPPADKQQALLALHPGTAHPGAGHSMQAGPRPSRPSHGHVGT